MTKKYSYAPAISLFYSINKAKLVHNSKKIIK